MGLKLQLFPLQKRGVVSFTAFSVVTLFFGLVCFVPLVMINILNSQSAGKEYNSQDTKIKKNPLNMPEALDICFFCSDTKAMV